MSTLLEQKCPCCGGAIEFNANTQNMKCPYCDAEFDVAQNPAHAEGGRYVVAVVDRCWNESKGSKAVEI